MTRKPSMMDVAALAGVSHQTVSRVINDSDKVSPATRSRVEAAIQELGFRPNLAARALVTRSSRLIGLLGPGESRFGPTSLTAAVQAAARERGFSTISEIVTSNELATKLEHFAQLGVDGLVVVAPTEDAARAAQTLASSLPIVLASSSGGDGTTTRIGVDQRLGAITATRTLLDSGRTRIEHLLGAQDWFDAQLRCVGWEQALTEAGLRPSPATTAGWDAAEGYRATDWLLANRPGFDGLCCANDLLAIGAMRRLAEAGISPGRDVGITGFDNIAGTDCLFPSLTTIEQPFDEVGRACVSELIDQVSDPATPVRVLDLPPKLILRESHTT